jgi:hypothetical protein
MDDMVNERALPAACTLPTAQRPLRRVEFDEFFAAAVRGVDRTGPGRVRLELTPDQVVAGQAAELLVRETECCSFFTFTLTATGGRLSLDIDVPPEHVDMLDAMAARAAGVASA